MESWINEALLHGLGTPLFWWPPTMTVSTAEICLQLLHFLQVLKKALVHLKINNKRLSWYCNNLCSKLLEIVFQPRLKICIVCPARSVHSLEMHSHSQFTWCWIVCTGLWKSPCSKAVCFYTIVYSSVFLSYYHRLNSTIILIAVSSSEYSCFEDM
jgi:hypothetical protein